MQRVCITVEDVPFTTWGITQTEPDFQHNNNNPSTAFDVGTLKNSKEFWVLYALSAYEGDIARDKDPNTERGNLGSSGGFVRVFCETIRDACKNIPGTQPYDTVLQRNLAHEILHCFLGTHSFIKGPSGKEIQDPSHYGNQGIMRQGIDLYAPPASYILNKKQIHVIQKKSDPKPL